MTRVPIACSLEAVDATTRVGEWRTLMATQVVEVIRTPGSVRLRLGDGHDALLVAADLARREKVCCAFFDFTVALLPEGVWLVVEAPDEAASVLDDLASLPIKGA
jgi:hypothetical protein